MIIANKNETITKEIIYNKIIYSMNISLGFFNK